MRIIENNYQLLKEPTKLTCDNCNSVFEVDEDEFVIGEYGLKGVACPVCGEMTYADSSVPLTLDNVCYPQHFARRDSEKCKKLSDDKINEYIKEAVSMINKDSDFSYVGTGDTIVFAFKTDEIDSEVEVIVCRNYDDTYLQIPREKF